MDDIKEKCPRCKNKVTKESDNISDGYYCACLNCDEDFYKFEIIIENDK